MDLTFANRAMQSMAGFAIQFNKNSFGLSPAAQLQVSSPLPANQQAETSLHLNTCKTILVRLPISISVSSDFLFTLGCDSDFEGGNMKFVPTLIAY